MTGDAVKRALEAAAMANLPNAAAAGDKPSRTELQLAARTVAAFLLKMPPEIWFAEHDDCCADYIGAAYIDAANDFHALAAAVTQAAQEGGGDG